MDVVDRIVIVPSGSGAAGDAVDLPGAAGSVGERQDLGQAVADDSGDADDQGYALMLLGRLIFFDFFLFQSIGYIKVSIYGDI